MSSSTNKTGFIAALALIATGVSAQIPIDAQARLLNDKIVAASREKNYPAVIGYIEQYRKLGSIFPNELLVTEAQAAYVSGDAARTLTILQAYLKIAKKTDPGYEDAIQMYSQVEHKADTDILTTFLMTLPGQMIQIPAGRFQMGTDLCVSLPAHFSEDGKSYDDWRLWVCKHSFLDARGQGEESAPAHLVTVSSFKMQATAIDFQTISAFAREKAGYYQTPYQLAVDFAARASKALKRHYRLPTEAEWEYAMVGGKPSPEKPWELCGMGTRCRDQNGHAVDARANAFGITSNISEVVSDCWHPTFSGAPTDGSAWDTNDCPRGTHTLRFGGYNTAYSRAPSPTYIDSPTPPLNSWPRFRLVE